MPTSVHIPKPVLEAVDRRARRLNISRNRFIVRALEKELAHESSWSPGFFQQLGTLDPEERTAVDQMLEAIRSRRTRKGPPRL